MLLFGDQFEFQHHPSSKGGNSAEVQLAFFFGSSPLTQQKIIGQQDLEKVRFFKICMIEEDRPC